MKNTNNKPLTAEEFVLKMAEEQTTATPDLPVNGTELGFAIRCAKEYAAQETAALREELSRIMELCGVQHVNDNGGALVAISFILKERQALADWKKSQLETFGPLLDYGQSKESGLKLGDSIVEEAIKALKGRKGLQEELEKVKKERNRALDDFSSLQFSSVQDKRRHLKELKAVKKERDTARTEVSLLRRDIFSGIRDAGNMHTKLAEVTRHMDEAVDILNTITKRAEKIKENDLWLSGAFDWLRIGIQDAKDFLSRLSSGETKPTKDINVLKVLSEISPKRSKEAFGLAVNDWTLPEWACALAGEVGELCNFIKKSNRDGKDRTVDISKEAADVAIYLDLLCTRAGIDLQRSIMDKFNEVSDRMNCEVKFPVPPES